MMSGAEAARPNQQMTPPSKYLYLVSLDALRPMSEETRARPRAAAQQFGSNLRPAEAVYSAVIALSRKTEAAAIAPVSRGRVVVGRLLPTAVSRNSAVFGVVLSAPRRNSRRCHSDTSV